MLHQLCHTFRRAIVPAFSTLPLLPFLRPLSWRCCEILAVFLGHAHYARFEFNTCRSAAKRSHRREETVGRGGDDPMASGQGRHSSGSPPQTPDSSRDHVRATTTATGTDQGSRTPECPHTDMGYLPLTDTGDEFPTTGSFLSLLGIPRDEVPTPGPPPHPVITQTLAGTSVGLSLTHTQGPPQGHQAQPPGATQPGWGGPSHSLAIGAGVEQPGGHGVGGPGQIVGDLLSPPHHTSPLSPDGVDLDDLISIITQDIAQPPEYHTSFHTQSGNQTTTQTTTQAGNQSDTQVGVQTGTQTVSDTPSTPAMTRFPFLPVYTESYRTQTGVSSTCVSSTRVSSTGETTVSTTPVSHPTIIVRHFPAFPLAAPPETRPRHKRTASGRQVPEAAAGSAAQAQAQAQTVSSASAVTLAQPVLSREPPVPVSVTLRIHTPPMTQPPVTRTRTAPVRLRTPTPPAVVHRSASDQAFSPPKAPLSQTSPVLTTHHQRHGSSTSLTSLDTASLDFSESSSAASSPFTPDMTSRTTRFFAGGGGEWGGSGSGFHGESPKEKLKQKLVDKRRSLSKESTDEDSDGRHKSDGGVVSQTLFIPHRTCLIL